MDADELRARIMTKLERLRASRLASARSLSNAEIGSESWRKRQDLISTASAFETAIDIVKLTGTQENSNAPGISDDRLSKAIAVSAAGVQDWDEIARISGYADRFDAMRAVQRVLDGYEPPQPQYARSTEHRRQLEAAGIPVANFVGISMSLRIIKETAADIAL